MADHSETSSGKELPEHEDADASIESTDSQDKEKLLDTAHARLDLAEEAESEIRKLALEDLEFRAGKQWPDAIQQERERDGRPCLVINRIPQFIQQVTNDQRQNRPAIKVHPVDDSADIETAKVIQGLIRHIEYNSSAEAAYDTAFEGAATGGFGYFRIVTDFADPKSFDQEIFIKRIRNQFSVFFDPYAQEPDGSDAAWAFITEDLSPEDYRAKYPKSELARESDWESIGNRAPSWIRSDSARVAEYFYREFKEVDLCLLSNGQVIEHDQLEDYAQAIMAQSQGAPLDIRIVKERTAQVPVIKWCKLNAVEILEETEWLGAYIPIVPVYGGELFINGKRILESVIRNAKDAQRMYNYWKSAQTEAIALAPRAPFIGAEGQFEGHENEWESANRKNHSYLEYKPVSLNGQAQPPPQRQAFEPAVQAITQAAMQAADEMKATTGIYDPSLGAQKADQSGVAIQKLNTQAQTSNFHFVDNLTRSLKHAGRILVDLIPKIYDTQRTARIIGEDGEQKIVTLNASQPVPGQESKDGKPLLYALDAGKYDVTVDVGPGYASKRQEAVVSMMDFARSAPQVAQSCADLIVKNMDWPGAQDIADRLKKMLPPNLQEQKPGQQQIPPQVQQQMQQMGSMIDQLTKQLHASQDVIDQKRVELESRERIEMAKLQVELELGMAKMGSVESMALLKHEIESIGTRLKMLGIDQPMAAEYQQFQQPQSPVQSPSGAPGADVGAAGAGAPTGGQSPGSPMEGYSNVDHSPLE